MPQLRCYICQSIYHISQQCPEKRDTYYTLEVVLYQSDFDHPDKLKNLMSETWNAMVLDSGTTNTVAGKIWFNCYVNSLNSTEKSKIQHHVGTNVHRLGDRNLVQAVENLDLPIAMSSKHVMLNTDIVPSDILLLLSRKSMIRAGITQIDFKNDQAIAFGEQIQLRNTKSGHYAIPIRPCNTILNNIATGTNRAVVLMATNKTIIEIAQKLHRQFAHSSPDKLLKLLNSADPWKNDEELKTLIKKISTECQICQLYKKAPPGPIVGLSMATAFQECVVMDLKFYKRKILLHLIDHATRLSASTSVPSKEHYIIINAIFRS